MTGYKSKKAAALDEDGMYLVHHTKRKDDEDDDTQVYKDHGDALTIAYQSGYYDGKKAALKLALRDLENAEIDGNCEYGATEIIRKALAQPAQEKGI